MRRLLTFAFAGLFAQLVDGSLGMGYGVTSTSVLVTAGTAAALASASVHLAEVGTSLVGGIAHHRFGNVDWRVVRWMAIPGAVGAFAGATALSSLSADAATPWVAVVLALLGVYVVIRSRSGHSVGELVARRPHGGRFLGVLGATAGFLDAAGGGGWGPLGTSTLLAAGRMEPRRVIGTVSASEFLVCVGASVGFFFALPWHQIDPAFVGALLLGGVLAAPLAAWISTRMDQRRLGTAIGLFIVATNARTLAAELGAGPSTVAAGTVVLGGAWLLFLGRALWNGRVRAGTTAPAPAVP